MPLSTFSRAGSEEGLTYLTKQEQHTLETKAYSQNEIHIYPSFSFQISLLYRSHPFKRKRNPRNGIPIKNPYKELE